MHFLDHKSAGKSPRSGLSGSVCGKWHQPALRRGDGSGSRLIGVPAGDAICDEQGIASQAEKPEI